MSASAVNIRRLSAEVDLERLLEIENSAFNRYDAYTRDDFVRWLGYTPDLCFAAEIDGRMVGYSLMRIQKGVGDLASLAIDPAYRRHRVGQALLAAMEQGVRAHGCSVITLEVRPSNSSGHAFWCAQGFTPFGRWPHFYEDGEDAIGMRKKIV